MKLLTFVDAGETHLGGMLDDDRVVDLTQAWGMYEHPLSARQAPTEVIDAIFMGDEILISLQLLMEQASQAKAPVHAAQDLCFLAPVPNPAKNIFCVGRNYRAHIVEANLARGRAADDFPKALEFFSKPPTTVVGHQALVSRHAAHTKMLDYEVELGIVIGKEGRDIPVEDALDYVFGYTVINDITARDLQALHGQWFKGKSLDGTCPIGPVVALKTSIADPNALDLELEVNGELRQSANTSDMLFDVPNIIAQLSAGMTLEPGDIIATGTPSGVGFAMQPPRSLEPGDVIKARIPAIGELVTTIE
ncbi:fumarylacetoacetate hydrolase family protein [Alcaligenes faecalis subsp. faecalis]|uniref:fumarylacetoacetate hydrolase family protein n=1 Tax=Alcaligenes faecalis TaxID=511 RepID=UPI001F3AFEB5|nr:fumarylacetoacetate hydrolase family protein [Alcaligenes faecalis]MBW4787012.1 fumarylacetoacetate hydrolase family protein [Alcaligenes faecalis subsp. faecalis]